MSVVGSEGPDDTHRRFIGTPHKPIGIDTEGYVHHANEQAGIVYQIKDGRVQGRVDIFEHPDPQKRNLDAYVDYVVEKRGFETRWLVKVSEVFGE